MNTSEQLYNITDTLHYLSDKVDRELRMIKALLKKLLENSKDNGKCEFCFTDK